MSIKNAHIFLLRTNNKGTTLWVITQARQIAMCTIHHVYEELHNEEEIDCEEMDKVKDAVEILIHTSNMIK